MFELKDETNILLQSDIKRYFYDWGYEVIDILECLTYLRKEYFLRDYEDVLEANIEAYNINCPIDFLDTDYIVRNDNDYLAVGNDFQQEYLNTHMLENGCFEELLDDGIIRIAEGNEFVVW